MLDEINTLRERIREATKDVRSKEELNKQLVRVLRA